MKRAAASATPIASANPWLMRNTPPPLACTREISESGRNLLACRSSRLISTPTALTTSSRFSGGHTATLTDVPSAFVSATAASPSANLAVVQTRSRWMNSLDITNLPVRRACRRRFAPYYQLSPAHSDRRGPRRSRST